MNLSQPPPITACEDDELVLRAQDHDDAAFGELMRRTSPAAMRLAVSILRDRQEAEDELQNSYVKAWRHVGQFQRESKFSSWISRIVFNQCLMRLRKLRAAQFLYLDGPGAEEGVAHLDLPDGCATPEDALAAVELSSVLGREIRRLPPLLRTVLILRDMEHLSSAEAAERLGISPSAVKSRLLRARAELRCRLQKHCGRAGAATLTA